MQTCHIASRISLCLLFNVICLCLLLQISAIFEYSSILKVPVQFREVAVTNNHAGKFAFACECEVAGKKYPQGVANTKKKAKTAAARVAMDMILEQGLTVSGKQLSICLFISWVTLCWAILIDLTTLPHLDTASCGEVSCWYLRSKWKWTRGYEFARQLRYGQFTGVNL